MKKAASILAMFGWITLAVGLVFLAVGAAFIYQQSWFSEHGIRTTATITGIEYKRKGTSRTHVKYEVDGKQYTPVLTQYSSSYHVGKNIEIYYDPDNPAKVFSPMILPIVFPILGALFAAGGIFMLVVHSTSKRKRTRLLAEGLCVQAEIVRTTPDTRVTINGRHPYHIFCEWTDTYGELHTFRSGGLMDDPAGQLKERGISTLPVYMEPGNPSAYHIDMGVLCAE